MIRSFGCSLYLWALGDDLNPAWQNTREFFNKFWLNSIRWLATDKLGKKKVTIHADRTAESGKNVLRIMATVLDKNLEPHKTAKVVLTAGKNKYSMV